MKTRKVKLIGLLASLSIGLFGCAISPIQPGEVVVVPEVEKPRPPVIVMKTTPKPVGYYQKLILDALEMP